ncbi:MAG: response regulator, partial [Acidimicrobiia bacterium]|nr:response regulator [Acidimicrobiia bacterium]
MGSKSATGVLIVDDEEDMRALLRSTIEIANQGLHVAGEAADGEDAVKQWRETRPEIVVLDQRMPGATGLEVAEQILAEHPEQAIILLSAYLDPDI